MQNNQGVTTAQKRVGEMNKLMQGYLEQGNRYIQQRNMQNGRNMQNMTKNVQAPPPVQPRFENVQSIQRQNIPENPPNRIPSDEPLPKQSGGFNSDNLLIIALAAVLMRENADIRLILALLYILI